MTIVSPAQPQQVMPYSPGTGRRKCAVAQVKLVPGTGKITINDRAVKDYFPREAHELLVTQPLRTTNVLNKYNVVVKVMGGGPSGQAGAVCQGIARALQRANPEFKILLRKGGYLTRDPRMKERKKPGLVRARRAKQYTKR